jgi:hypothetical protein
MSKFEKLKNRFRSKPKDFSFDELRTLMSGLGYTENNEGKTSGSVVSFVNAATGHIIKMHKPHPGNILKRYQLDLFLDNLKGRNLI